MAAVLFRIIILLVVPAAFSFAFLVAFAKLYDPDHQQINGVILGVVATIAWVSLPKTPSA